MFPYVNISTLPIAEIASFFLRCQITRQLIMMTCHENTMQMSALGYFGFTVVRYGHRVLMPVKKNVFMTLDLICLFFQISNFLKTTSLILFFPFACITCGIHTTRSIKSKMLLASLIDPECISPRPCKNKAVIIRSPALFRSSQPPQWPSSFNPCS